MKKSFFAILMFLAATLLFAADYEVKSVFGSVNYETSPGKWSTVAVGQKLTDTTVVNLGVNSTLVIVSEGKEFTIKAMQKGTIFALIQASTASTGGLRMSPTDTSIRSVEDATDSTGKGSTTAASRAGEAMEDMELDE